MRRETFRMERITCVSQEITKLEDFNLNIYEGEILGFVPVTSYGMRDFLGLLKENTSLYDGYVYYNEIMVNSWKGPLFSTNRITVIEHTSSLVEQLTVVDNIFVLRKKFRGEYIRPKNLGVQLEPFLAEINMKISANTYVSKLSVFERIVVELLKGVISGHKLIVLYEIEALLTANELKELYDIIRYYAKKGISFLYICSHLEETITICDRAVLFVNGRVEKVLQAEDMQVENILSVFLDYASLVRGHLKDRKEYQYSDQQVCEVMYQFQNIEAPFRFEVRHAECLVIQCLDNDMYYQLRNAIVKDEVRDDCTIFFDYKKEPLHGNSKVGIIQEFASKTMLFPEMTYMDNLCFNLGSRMSGVWLKRNIRNSIRLEFKDEIEDEVFETSILDLTEKQKYQLVYTRILLQKPKVVFCIQPFQGADMNHRMYIWTLLEKLIKRGISIVILAVNLGDTLSIADRFIRVDDKNQQYEFFSDEFASMPSVVPWQYLYEQYKNES